MRTRTGRRAGVRAPEKRFLINYTQTSDVEIETNGLLTYDRAVSKYSPAALRQVHGEIYRAFEEAVKR